MRFAGCTKKIEISGIRKCFEGAVAGSVNLGLGQPDFDTPEHIKNAAIRAIQKGQCGYTPNCGVPELRAALAGKFQRENHIDCTAEEIMVTSGASEALFLIIAALVDQGDEVLIGDPAFLSYVELTRLVGGRPVAVPLDQNLRLDPEAIQERITDRTRLIIVNSPSNPTGSVGTAGQMRAIAEIADDRDIAVLSDEVYEHFIYKGEHVSPGQFSDNVITVNAVSKTYSMTGWRLGYLAAKGGALEELLKIHQYVQACASSISQAAALEAVTGPQDCVAAMRDEFRARRDLLVKGFKEMGVDLIVPDGAFYLFPKVGDGDAVAAKLGKAGVIVVPGSAFGAGGREHIRISYAAARCQLEEALRRMKDIL
ncbi:MAG TPA: pyridoxal phosphate-dependent aminotransferase [Methanothrix sp.]|nr:pyridoxal phosphate-dependent aminotransferase [Methanothrix sp.]HPT37898.1 pyridoxal phosphate-dependent aminotransferase [Methanothrix sp.]